AAESLAGQWLGLRATRSTCGKRTRSAGTTSLRWRVPTKSSSTRRAPLMSTATEAQTEVQSARDWHALAQRVLEGHAVTAAEAEAILHSSDDELLDVLSAAFVL